MAILMVVVKKKLFLLAGAAPRGGLGAVSPSWFRSRMTDDRLSTLFLINVCNRIDILDQIDRIIDIFANLKNRRLEFVL